MGNGDGDGDKLKLCWTFWQPGYDGVVDRLTDSYVDRLHSPKFIIDLDLI